MLRTIVGLPLRAARAVVHTITGGGVAPPPGPRPADAWELRRVAINRGQAAAAAGDAVGEHHQHGHDHGHSHGHNDGPQPLRIDVAETPNPEAMKFTANRPVLASGSVSFNSDAEAANHPLGAAVFAISGVAGVFATADFVTITKDADAEWHYLQPAIIDAIEGALEESPLP